MSLLIENHSYKIESICLGKIIDKKQIQNDKNSYIILNVKLFYLNNSSHFSGFISNIHILKDLPKKYLKKAGIFNFNKTDSLNIGDIVCIHPNGSIVNLFKEDSLHNSIFVTERCNNSCIMCSQPPKRNNDIDEFYSINSKLINLLPSKLHSIGITGGEPTLLGTKLFLLLEKMSQKLPNTLIHILTNARLFSQLEFTQLIASLENQKISFGVPIFSDFYQIHDFIAQRKGSFYQTLLGLNNLARYNQRIELRVILQKHTCNRLLELSQFIFLNLPFVEHIAFMGIEYFGQAKENESDVWIDPEEFIPKLNDAIDLLVLNKMNVSIYNLPLCLLPNHLWSFCKKSITEWKKSYFDKCNSCQQREICGGVFSSSKEKLII